MKESYNKGLADHIAPESCLERSRGLWGAELARQPKATVDRGTVMDLGSCLDNRHLQKNRPLKRTGNDGSAVI
jgi:hypothetical protein